jgi:hypothetical protein
MVMAEPASRCSGGRHGRSDARSRDRQPYLWAPAAASQSGGLRRRQHPDIAVMRPSTATWYIRCRRRQPVRHRLGDGGISRDGDYDGDGKADIAVFQPSTGTWYPDTLRRRARPCGRRGRVPCRLTSTATEGRRSVFRPSTGTWFIRNGATPTIHGFWSGPRCTSARRLRWRWKGRHAVFRPPTGTWCIRNTAHACEHDAARGQAGDIPSLKS